MKNKQTAAKDSWDFHLTSPIAKLSKVTLAIHTEFWLSTLQTWFRGYQTPEGHEATIWGKKTGLWIAIAPLGTPTETLPVIEEKTARVRNAQLPPEQQAYVGELQKKIKALKKLLPPKVDEALEQRYLDDMNADRIKAIVRDCTAIWSDGELSVEEKISRLIPYKIEMYELVSIVRLPDELIRADTNISILMATIQFFAQAMEKNAKKYKIKIPGQVRQLARLAGDIVTRMNEAQDKLNGVEREMSEKEHDAYLGMERKADSALCPFEERLSLYEQLWKMPSVSTGNKIRFMNGAIRLVRKQYGKSLEPRCPHESLVREHLRAIADYMDELEKEGKAAWQWRMAGELLPAANAYREDSGLPPLARSGLASQIELQSANIKTVEGEGGAIHYKLELFFQDADDTFAGHFLYADIEDHKIKEITLMG